MFSNIIFCFSLFISFCFHAEFYSQDIKRLDKDYGFRNFKFEMNIADCKNMKQLSGNGDYKYYTCTDDTLSWGQYPIKELSYGFYHGKLYWIALKVNDSKNSRGVLRLLESTYGPGRKFNEYSETHGWDGEKVKMAYNENTFNKNAIINIWSQSEADLIKEEEEDKK